MVQSCTHDPDMLSEQAFKASASYTGETLSNKVRAHSPSTVHNLVSTPKQVAANIQEEPQYAA